MRLYALIACGALAACTSSVNVPSEAVLYEVPQHRAQAFGRDAVAGRDVAGGGGAVAGRDDFTSRIESVLAAGDAPAAAPAGPPLAGVTQAPPALAGATQVPPAAAPVPPGAAATPLDDDLLNLNLYTLEQQRIDAAIAERELEAARRQLIIVQPGQVPQATEGANIALFAQQTRHAVGERRYSRRATGFVTARGNCRRFATPDEAQRVFLANGGPERDPLNLDPDGDGFACDWDPEPYRRLRL